jgi:hypothetical protein
MDEHTVALAIVTIGPRRGLLGRRWRTVCRIVYPLAWVPRAAS